MNQKPEYWPVPKFDPDTYRYASGLKADFYDLYWDEEIRYIRSKEVPGGKLYYRTSHDRKRKTDKLLEYFRNFDWDYELEHPSNGSPRLPRYPGDIPSVLKNLALTLDTDWDAYPGFPRKHHPGPCRDTFFHYVFSLETLGLARYINLDYIPYDNHHGSIDYPWAANYGTVRQCHFHQIDCNCGYDINTYSRPSREFIVTEEGKRIPDPNQDWDSDKLNLSAELDLSPFTACTAGYSYHYDQSEQGFTLYSSYIDVALAQGRPDKNENVDPGVPYHWYQHVSGNHANLGHEPSVFSMNRRSCGSLLTNSANNQYESRNEQGFKVWSYGDSKVLFGPMPDCNSDCDDCNQPNFVIGWLNVGNLKLLDFTIPDNMKFRCLVCDPDSKKLAYKHSPYCQFYMDDYICMDYTKEEGDSGDEIHLSGILNGVDVGFSRRTIDKGINYGLEIDHLLRVQGNPTVIIPYVDSDDTDLDSIDNHGGSSWYYGGGEIKSSNAQNVTFEKPLSTIFISPSRKIAIDHELSENYSHPKFKSQCDAIFEQITNTGIVPTRYFPNRVCGWENVGDLKLAPEQDISSARNITSKLDATNFRIKQRIKESLDKFENFNKYLNEENTSEPNNPYRNFMLKTKTYGNYEKGAVFEKFCKDLLEAMGYIVEATGQTSDGGIDLKAKKSDGIATNRYLVQCKNYPDGSVGPSVLRELSGILVSQGADKGIVMTTGKFTRDSEAFVAQVNNIEILDGSSLENLSKKFLRNQYIN